MKTATNSLARADSSPAILLFAAALGVFLIYGAGFAQAPTLHDAAHDTRHSNGFPCH